MHPRISLGVLVLATCVAVGGQAQAGFFDDLVCGAAKATPTYWLLKAAVEGLKNEHVINSKDECLNIGDYIGDLQIPTGVAKDCVCNDIAWPVKETTQISENFQGDPHWVHIDTPEVRQAETKLMIPVFSGDRVWVMAGGCVQTGGHGNTWKRYVAPTGSNADRLYHGQIKIPGAIEQLTNLYTNSSNHIVPGDGQWSPPFTVGANHQNTAEFISLGYTDDGYGDNGYWGHDDGTQNQCKGIGNAWLHLYICRADSSHGPTC
jgi:hypothetical protein